jgi:hypothetical protein
MTISESSPGPLEPSDPVDLAAPDTTPDAVNDERIRQLARRQKRMLYVSMSATLLLGLTTTASYIRGRMLEATPAAPAVARARIAEAPRKANPAPPPAPVAEKKSPLAEPEPPKTAPPPAAPVKTATPAQSPVAQPAPLAAIHPILNLIDPRQGEVYLQLAALDRQRSENYLGYLEQNQLHARMAPGPSADLFRIVLGPFPDEAEMLRVKARLDRDSIVNIVRKY